MISIENTDYGPTPLHARQGMNAFFRFQVVTDGDETLSASVQLTDKNGVVRKTMSDTKPGPSAWFSFKWDGRDDAGNVLHGNFAPVFHASGGRNTEIQMNFCTGVQVFWYRKFESTDEHCKACEEKCKVGPPVPQNPADINSTSDPTPSTLGPDSPATPPTSPGDIAAAAGVPSLTSQGLAGAFGVPNGTTGPNGNLARILGVPNGTTGPNGNLARILGVPNGTTGPDGNLAALLGVPNLNIGTGSNNNLAAFLGIPNINVGFEDHANLRPSRTRLRQPELPAI